MSATTYRQELKPGRYAYAHISPDGAATFSADDDSSFQASLLPAPGAVPLALLRLAGEITFPGWLSLTPEQDIKQRLAFIKAVSGRYTSPDILLLDREALPPGLTGEEMLLLGTQGYMTASTLPGRLACARSLAEEFRTCFIPWGYLSGKEPGIAPHRLAPEELSPITTVAGEDILIRSITAARQVSDLATFVLGQEDRRAARVTRRSLGRNLMRHETLGEFLSRTNVADRALILRNASRINVERLAGQKDGASRDPACWWEGLPGNTVSSLTGLDQGAVRQLMERGTGCRTPGSVALLVRIAAAGDLPKGNPGANRQQVRWCADIGLSDWVLASLLRKTGDSHVATRILQQVSEEAELTADDVSAVAWDQFLSEYDELKDAPVSWWMALAG